jgi:RNA polymerase sigma factor (sigma-70 family)
MSARVRLPLRLPGVHAGVDDRALIGRFAAERDEAAFASLIWQHGVMVLGVCRRAVGDAHLAEDAFQATFLVLARNPAAAAGASSVAGWLFGVARRVGLAARRSKRRRERRESLAGPGCESGGSSRADFDDLLRVLDEELAALPTRYRDPLIACFLRKPTQDEAAPLAIANNGKDAMEMKPVEFDVK